MLSCFHTFVAVLQRSIPSPFLNSIFYYSWLLIHEVQYCILTMKIFYLVVKYITSNKHVAYMLKYFNKWLLEYQNLKRSKDCCLLQRLERDNIQASLNVFTCFVTVCSRDQFSRDQFLSGMWPACTWLLEITLCLQTYVCVCTPKFMWYWSCVTSWISNAVATFQK